MASVLLSESRIIDLLQPPYSHLLWLFEWCKTMWTLQLKGKKAKKRQYFSLIRIKALKWICVPMIAALSFSSLSKAIFDSKEFLTLSAGPNKKHSYKQALKNTLKGKLPHYLYKAIRKKPPLHAVIILIRQGFFSWILIFHATKNYQKQFIAYFYKSCGQKKLIFDGSHQIKS